MPNSDCSSVGDKSPKVSRSTIRSRAGSASAAYLAALSSRLGACSISIDSILTELNSSVKLMP